ncbi:hypothetical protein LTS16_011213 [Friedmanniomyces endolithicus]|nr:hypothetical protein LTS01_010568 [Friedmanniomyces endolithicus]KAK1039397.1 hypothetical protein LTS16_011213 [Friedmanniomyces endolithicus]
MSWTILCAPFADTTCADMCVSDPSLWVPNWMSAMANYPPPPPPPLPDHQQYNSLYPASVGAHHKVESGQQPPLQYTSLNTPSYPKIESVTPAQRHNAQLQDLAQELSQHAALEDSQCHETQQTSQPLQQQGLPHVQPTAHAGAPQIPEQLSAQEIARSNRLRKACDSCSVRKVKRPSRRRGPPNRHAEAIKRRRLEEGGSLPSGQSSPSSPTHAALGLNALSSSTAGYQLTADSICPIETLDLLIDDFFTYIHPLCPFPHEPSFREAWKRREDVKNKAFLALLASMIGALVSSFPRKPRQHLKAHKREHMFPNHMSLVHRCQQVCAVARGPGYLESESLSVYDAATSYFLAVMTTYTFRWRLGRLYFGECLTILRTLGLHKPTGHSYAQLGSLPLAMGSRAGEQDGNRDQPVDNITLEMGRRIFWTMFVSVKTIQQLGASFGELVIPPSTPSDPYPPLPVEVDDFCIYPTHNEQQPAGLLPMTVGFNTNVKVFSSYDPLATMELAWGIDAVVDWERQKRVLHESLRRCKRSIAELPPELKVYPNGSPFGRTNQQNGDSYSSNSSHVNSLQNPRQPPIYPSLPLETEQSPELRRRMQYEIQKANTYASALSTRSYIVEKYFNLCEAHDRLRSQSQLPGSMPSSPGTGVTAAGIDGMLPQAPTSHFDVVGQEMRQEREEIIKDLLVVLSSINQVNMEPNGNSFTMKIRAIASTLLEVSDQRKGQIALQAQDYLATFLKILMKLERVSPANGDQDQPEDEEAELQHWADLREYQLKFAQQGGLVGLS